MKVSWDVVIEIVSRVSIIRKIALTHLDSDKFQSLRQKR